MGLTMLRSWRRGSKINGDKGVLIQDELAPKVATDITWHFHTKAQVTLARNRRNATLREGYSTIRVSSLIPSECSL
jgi:hypothetical protein